MKMARVVVMYSATAPRRKSRWALRRPVATANAPTSRLSTASAFDWTVK